MTSTRWASTASRCRHPTRIRSGVWVASVETATAAERANLVPGDVITQLDGTDVATDGTMQDYCDIIRTDGADAVIPMTVVPRG